jgi:hypothetical protein
MLAQQQAAFMAQVLDDEAALPPGWTARHAAGMAVYRNNYRTALVEAMRATYERTARWVGEAAFARAAAHHLILHPPSSWTLDVIGDGFPDTLAELFAHDPEVPELAALEWAMHCAFTAADATPLDGLGLAAATAAFSEEDWGAMRIAFVPGCAVVPASHDLAALWQALATDPFDAPDYALAEPACLQVWREGLNPVFRPVDLAAGRALELALGGASFGEVCAALVEALGEDAGVARAGALLGEWLGDALVASVRC